MAENDLPRFSMQELKDKVMPASELVFLLEAAIINDGDRPLVMAVDLEDGRRVFLPIHSVILYQTEDREHSIFVISPTEVEAEHNVNWRGLSRHNQ